jgi:DNA-binding beta-propeller fold protein YncE
MSAGESEPTSDARRDHRAMLIILAATFLARVVPAWLLGAEVSDLGTYRHMALTVLRYQDIYDIPNFFPYTPLSLFLPALALRLAGLTGLPFHMTMKIFPLAGDLGTAALVYLTARHHWPIGKARLAGLAFAFNPVSILVTGLHGNLMPLSVCFAFWAYYLVEFPAQRRSYLLSALALGVAIGLRSWPVLLTPLLARPGRMNWRQRIAYVVVAALPALLVLAPYMAVNADGIWREAFDYKSTPDFGWLAIWRYWRFRNGASTYMPWPKDWLSNSRFYFLAAYGMLVGVAYLRPRASDTTGWIIATLLLNYTLLGGVAAQYFSWIVPFLVLRPYFGTAFSVIAAMAMLAFYFTWHQGILFGPYRPPFVLTRVDLLRVDTISLAALWITGLLWLIGFAAQTVRGRPAAAAVDAQPLSRRTPAGSRRVNVALAVLAGAVGLTLAFEIPYLVRSRPAIEWPAHLAWVMNRRGDASDQLAAPRGVAVLPAGDVYVADVGNARVQRFSSSGEFLSAWPRIDAASPGFIQPTDVTVSANGAVYALDSAGSIARLEDDGSITQVADLTPWSVYSPQALALDEARGRFYVADTGKSRVLVIGLDGKLIATWGGAGKPLSFDLGRGIAVDTAGNVLVAEQGNSRVRKLSPEGVILAEWWVKGDLYDIAVGPDDRVYVTASDRPRLWIYDNDGKELAQVYTPLVARGLTLARGVAAAAPDDLVLTTEGAVVRLLIDEEQ